MSLTGPLFLNGVISVTYSLGYRQPLVFFWTIPGTVLIAPALGHLSFAEVVGAYIVTGAVMIALTSALSHWQTNMGPRRCTTTSAGTRCAMSMSSSAPPRRTCRW